jgi:hypothetical protein
VLRRTILNEYFRNTPKAAQKRGFLPWLSGRGAKDRYPL